MDDLPGDTKRGNERLYCSLQDTESNMLGTADPVDVWLFLEYKASWPARAITEGGLTQEIQDWLDKVTADCAELGLKLRPQLVRQPEIDSDFTRLMVAANGSMNHFQGRGYDFLLELSAQDLLARPEPHSADRGPLYFVCTNGKRDLCCARFGLPVYQGLRELVGDRVWQVTHLGGHRFAPNVLVSPANILYGRLAVDELADYVRQVDSGAVAFANLRGRTAYPQAVQAAEGFIAQPNLRLLHAEGTAAELLVTFADEVRRHQVTVQRQRAGIEILASCDKTETKTYHPFEMAHLADLA